MVQQRCLLVFVFSLSLLLAGCGVNGDSTSTFAVNNSPTRASSVAAATPPLRADPINSPETLTPCAYPARLAGGQSPTFCVLGDVVAGSKVTLANLEDMPAITVKASSPSARGSVIHTYTGVLLMNVLSTVGLSSAAGRTALGASVSVTSSDGHWVSFSLAELEPDLGGTSALLAYREDGHLLGSDGMAKLVVPSDKQAGRWSDNVAEVYVYTYARSLGHLANPAAQPQPPNSLRITGLGPSSLGETLPKLEAMPATSIMAKGPSAHDSETHRYTGVPLSDLLQLQPRAEGERLGMSVSVLPNNGEWVTFSLAEISPEMGKTTALLAYKEDGHLLGANGFAELVVPSDMQTSRWVDNVVEVYVYYPFPPVSG